MYLFDANPLIDAKNRHYRYSVCPGFWDWLVLERTRENVMSIDPIRSELLDPDIKAWADANPQFFAQERSEHIRRMPDVVAVVSRHPTYTAAAKDSFYGSADARLIAFALADGHTIVTHEVSAARSMKTVKIPDACSALSIACMDTYEVLDLLHARFVLEGQR